MCCLTFSIAKTCSHSGKTANDHAHVTFSIPLLISSPWYPLCCLLLRLKSFSLFNNSSHRKSLLIVLAIFIFTKWCNLYYPISFYCYLLCTISHSTTSFEVQQRGRRYSCRFKIYLGCICIVRLWFFSILFSFLFLINPNIQFWLGFSVCWGFFCFWEHRAHILTELLTPSFHSWMIITSSASLTKRVK